MSHPTITIGTVADGGKPLKLDVGRLIVSKVLITASSGGGKSYLLRRVLEQVSLSTQTIVIDPEGEFATLREKRDMLLVGPQGETPAEPRAASLLCRRLMELNISAVIDVSDLPPSQRRLFVANFCNTMVDLPRSLWRPCVVAIDETHEYAPEGEKSDCGEAVALLASKGRKRGYCLLSATQRLSKLSKDVAAECKDRFIGQMTLDVDLRRACDLLGFGKDRWRELMDLDPGEFFAFGPSMPKGIVKMKGAEVETTHPRAGQGRIPEPPAPSAKIRGVLEELKDLPQQADQEIKDLSAAKARIVQLEREVAVRPRPQPVPKNDPRDKATIATLRRALEQAMKVIEQATKARPTAELVDRDRIKESIDRLTGQVRENLTRLCDTIITAAEASARSQAAEFERLRAKAAPIVAKLQELLASAGPIAMDQPIDTILQQFRDPRLGQPWLEPSPATGTVQDAEAREAMDPVERRVVDSLAWWAIVMGVQQVNNLALAARARYATTTKTYQLARGAVVNRGLVEVEQGLYQLTEAGRTVANAPAIPASIEALHAEVLAVLDQCEAKVLKSLLAAYPNRLTNQELAEKSAYSTTTKTYQLARGRLKALGLSDSNRDGYRAADRLFPKDLTSGLADWPARGGATGAASSLSVA